MVKSRQTIILPTSTARIGCGPGTGGLDLESRGLMYEVHRQSIAGIASGKWAATSNSPLAFRIRHPSLLRIKAEN